jgi:DNA-binding CsgD family transcriptional regulator
MGKSRVRVGLVAGLPGEDATSSGAEQISLLVSTFAERHGLSQRECEVLGELLLGTHPKAIGERVGCGYSSVRTHLRRIYRKVSCSGSRELVLALFCGTSAPSR